ncbi:N-acetyl-gamma-glutamyl-phosphate reductase [Granulicella sp. WH15]|uniref:N-acetyl-gamma-glutamyl-phosphate reductase n=1 Tax=Granulicella sp. WH15 TaxID=2602070 RepID=UPI0013669BD8|nr:N-acetyl-gamma-glutamyl-phosphate reductase [Granulicella sp. WH15]QHN03138.1 N-acetyl-gamma-glutamyl-phosphate reductase [Granulicella sp. WH15]
MAEKKIATTVKTAVIGVGGYSGGELARLLLKHPRLVGTAPLFLGRAGEENAVEVPLEQIQPQLALGAGQVLPKVVPFSWERLEAEGVEVVFLATPHESSRGWVPEMLARGLKVIDLSGAWRLNEDANRAVYKFHDADEAAARALQAEAVYGCPELHREKIATARLVANPGCYATSILLPLAPLVQAGLVDVEHGIICDAKSGVSGAGKGLTPGNHFISAADNLSVYKVFNHRHRGEMLEQLGIAAEQIQFTPHLLPIPRGILSTIYLRLNSAMQPDAVEACLREFYATSPMVRIHKTPGLPQIQHVVRNNYADIGFELAADGRRLVMVSCLDNLLKGASGQAVQNLNVMCGWSEEEGLL